MPKVFAIFDADGFTINVIQFQYGDRSVDLHDGQIFDVVTHLQLRHANSFTMSFLYFDFFRFFFCIR